ncbi:MAG: hypothetical protein IJB62_09400 [Alistipes sp.]|nr:hypothetical protein [Alistipes sp.]
MVVDLDAVLGHDQLVDFISALQFLSEQFAVSVGIGDVRPEVIVQLVVGVCPSAVLSMLRAFGYHVVGKLPDVVSHDGSCIGNKRGQICDAFSLRIYEDAVLLAFAKDEDTASLSVNERINVRPFGKVSSFFYKVLIQRGVFAFGQFNNVCDKTGFFNDLGTPA